LTLVASIGRTPFGVARIDPACDMPAKAKASRPYAVIEWLPGANAGRGSTSLTPSP
jgi:hypothetical protein